LPEDGLVTDEVVVLPHAEMPVHSATTAATDARARPLLSMARSPDAGVSPRNQGSGFRVPGSGFRVPGFRVPGSGFRGSGFRGSGFRVPGSGFRGSV